MRIFFLFILLSVFLFGCTTANEELGTISVTELVDELMTAGNNVPDKEEFAENFRVKKDSIFSKVEIFSPWEAGKVLYTYYLVKNDSVQTPADGVKIKVPLQNIAVNSCSHVAYIDALGKIDKIVASSDPEFVYNENRQPIKRIRKRKSKKASAS